MHALDENGEKMAVTLDSSTQQCTIGETAYSYQNRPAVPAAPQKPAEPSKPSPPAWTSGPLEVETIIGEREYSDNRRYTKESFSSREEAQRKSDFYHAQAQRYAPSTLDRAHALRVATMISDSIAICVDQQKQYEIQLARYQADLPNYQQNVAKYNKDTAEYQANLPKYQAAVDTEIKSIQGSINPNAPENWVGYVEGKYLLYKGKIK